MEKTAIKIDFSQPVLDAEGEPSPRRLLGNVSKPDEPATLGFLIASALLTPLPDDEKLSGIKKAEIGELGLRLNGGGEQEVSSEECATIRNRAGMFFSPLYAARIFAVIP